MLEGLSRLEHKTPPESQSADNNLEHCFVRYREDKLNTAPAASMDQGSNPSFRGMYDCRG